MELCSIGNSDITHSGNLHGVNLGVTGNVDRAVVVGLNDSVTARIVYDGVNNVDRCILTCVKLGDKDLCILDSYGRILERNNRECIVGSRTRDGEGNVLSEVDFIGGLVAGHTVSKNDGSTVCNSIQSVLEACKCIYTKDLSFCYFSTEGLISPSGVDVDGGLSYILINNVCTVVGVCNVSIRNVSRRILVEGTAVNGHSTGYAKSCILTAGEVTAVNGSLCTCLNTYGRAAVHSGALRSNEGTAVNGNVSRAGNIHSMASTAGSVECICTAVDGRRNRTVDTYAVTSRGNVNVLENESACVNLNRTCATIIICATITINDRTVRNGERSRGAGQNCTVEGIAAEVYNHGSTVSNHNILNDNIAAYHSYGSAFSCFDCSLKAFVFYVANLCNCRIGNGSIYDSGRSGLRTGDNLAVHICSAYSRRICVDIALCNSRSAVHVKSKALLESDLILSAVGEVQSRILNSHVALREGKCTTVCTVNCNSRIDNSQCGLVDGISATNDIKLNTVELNSSVEETDLRVGQINLGIGDIDNTVLTLLCLDKAACGRLIIGKSNVRIGNIQCARVVNVEHSVCRAVSVTDNSNVAKVQGSILGVVSNADNAVALSDSIANIELNSFKRNVCIVGDCNACIADELNCISLIVSNRDALVNLEDFANCHICLQQDSVTRFSSSNRFLQRGIVLLADRSFGFSFYIINAFTDQSHLIAIRTVLRKIPIKSTAVDDLAIPVRCSRNVLSRNTTIEITAVDLSSNSILGSTAVPVCETNVVCVLGSLKHTAVNGKRTESRILSAILHIDSALDSTVVDNEVSLVGRAYAEHTNSGILSTVDCAAVHRNRSVTNAGVSVNSVRIAV